MRQRPTADRVAIERPHLLLLACVVLSSVLIGGRAEARYVAPSRSVEQIVHAIGISRPGMSRARRGALARVLIEVARKHNFDPLSGWAIIDRESGWRANAVGADGQDIGLAQIRYSVRAPCAKDPDSEACTASRQRLFDPTVNIRMMAGAITAWRGYCTEKMGKPPNMRDWLAGYQGYARPKQRKLCGHAQVRQGKKWIWKALPVPKNVQRVLDARRRMIRRLRKDGVR